MATIKSYTDLSQSRKLAEILPLESADMWWTALNWQETEYYVEVKQDGISQPKKAISCWSLAALINIIPQEIFDGKYIINITEGLNNKWVLTYDHFENRNHSYYGLFSGADNFVDACVDMILKLKERNLL